MPQPEPLVRGELRPRSVLPEGADTLLIAQLVLETDFSRATVDGTLVQLEATVASLLGQVLPPRSELLVLVHAAPGDAESLGRLAEVLPGRPRSHDRRLVLVEDADPARRGALTTALADLDASRYRRVIRVRSDLGDELDPTALTSMYELARIVRHSEVAHKAGPLLATSVAPPLRWCAVLDAPEDLAPLDGLQSPLDPRVDEMALVAALGGATAFEVTMQPTTGVTDVVSRSLDLALTAVRTDTGLRVDCDLTPFQHADATICYYVIQGNRRVALRWYAADSTATFKDVPEKVLVRGFLRVQGRDVARAESGVL